MKMISRIMLLAGFAALLLAACNKVGDLPMYKTGLVPQLATYNNVTAIAPEPKDSLSEVVTFNWTDPEYATDSSNVKYIIEMDSTGRGFAKAARKTIMSARSATFHAKEINDILLGWGFEFGKPYDVDIRIISSYANNNDQKISNTITLSMTPYKVPPRVPLPTSGKLYLVGDATDGSWSNPVPTPTQEFARINETTFAGVFHLTGGKQYLMLPENGSWDHKFAVADNSVAGLADGGEFGYDFGQNFPGPAADGVYKIVVDFQTGHFSVTKYTENNLPTDLFMVGDATPGGWSNPVPVPSQQLTRLNAAEWELTVDLTGGKQYLLLPTNGSWDHKYSVDDNSISGLADGGSFGYDKPQNFPGPAADGNYTLRVNFVTSSFTMTKN